MWKELAKSIREYKKPSLLTPSFVAVEVAIECLIPFITALLVNQIKAGSGLPVIIKYGSMLLAMASISLVCGIFAGRYCASASAGFAKNLRKDMFYNIQSFSFENIDRFSSSSLVTRLTTDVTNVQMAYMMLIRLAIKAPLALTFSVIMAAIMGGRLAIIFAVVIPVLGTTLYVIIKKAHPIFKQVFRRYDVFNNSVQETIRGIRVVKSFVREDYENEKFDRAAEDVRKNFTRAEKILAFNGPVMQLCLYTGIAFILTYGSYTIAGLQRPGFDVGQLSALVVYSFQILNSLMMLSSVFVMVTISDESVFRIVEILEEKSTLSNPPDPIKEVTDGSVDFSGVSFRYSEKAERMALENIDLHIKSGETVGIIGGTGAAKTTLIQLIPRLYDVTRGTVSVGGKDVRSYDIEALRNQVAVVLQNNLLFSGTISDNLRWGNPNATDEELVEACKLAQAHEFVSSFHDGYNTRIDQGGINVSGGQKQRLCIARALLKKPKLLILDDSTSAVDTHTDAKIREAFVTYIPETTKIIIAQRISSVQDADKIVLMEGGGISAVGTHEELLSSSEIYREVFESQSKVVGQ